MICRIVYFVIHSYITHDIGIMLSERPIWRPTMAFYGLNNTECILIQSKQQIAYFGCCGLLFMDNI